MTQTKAIRMPGKDRPAASQTRTQGLRRRSLTIRIAVKTRNPPPSRPQAKQQRVSIADSFGASPVSSALGHSAGRDPGGVSTTLTRNHGS